MSRPARPGAARRGWPPGAIGEHGGGAAPGAAGDSGAPQVLYELAAVAAAGMRGTGRDGMGSWRWGQRERVLARPDPTGSGWVFAPAQTETMAGASRAG